MIEEFNYKRDGKYLAECDSCGAIAPLSKFRRRKVGHINENRDLCELCASSQIGTATDYLTENVDLFRAIAQVGNLILDKITKRREELQNG